MGSSSAAPVLLRLALGITFLWAGTGKVLQTMPVQGERAAALATMGVSITPTTTLPGSPSGAAPGTVIPDGPATPREPADTSPGGEAPGSPPPADAGRGTGAGPSREGSIRPVSLRQGSSPESPASPSRTTSEPTPGATSTSSPSAGPTRPVFVASQFPEPVEVKRVYGLALLIQSAANPPARTDGKPAMPLWPAALAKDNLPVVFAWAAALTELVGGVFCLVGLLTRLSGLGLAGTMAAAMWLTQIGPAIQSGQTYLGFLPRHDIWGVNAAGNPLYAMLLWQFALCCVGLALLFTGAGGLSIDRALFPDRGSGRGSDGPRPSGP